MSRYFRIPDTTGIEVIQFSPDVELPDGVKVVGSDEAGFEVFNRLHDSWIKLTAGRYIRIDKAPQDVYPIEEGYLKENFVEHAV
jgi:hypothetical protein